MNAPTTRRKGESITPAAGKVIDEALRLSPAARAALAGLLLDSLDETIDEDAATAWEAEVSRRVAELAAGTVTPIPWSEARRTIEGS